jgi:phosphoserine phosphatase
VHACALYTLWVLMGDPCATRLQEKWGIDGIVMVGDGSTDAEARAEGVASLFIGCVHP